MAAAIREIRPWNDNLLRPCPVLDNPGKLTEIVEKSRAKNTDYQNLESAKEFSDKCVGTAEKWTLVAHGQIGYVYIVRL